jgi:hypothetical protein
MEHQNSQLSKLCVVCGNQALVDVYQAFSRLEPAGMEFRHQAGDEFGHRYYCQRHVPLIFAEALKGRPSRAA